MTSWMEDLVVRIRSVLPKRDGVFPLHEPTIGDREKELVAACLDSTFVSSVGKEINQFEERLQEITGAPHAIAMVNGTSALHLCLLSCGVKAGDEVLVPSMSFVATSNAIAYLGATPHFVDCEEATLGIDPIKLREYLSGFRKNENGDCINPKTGRRIACLVVMHTFGYIGKMDELLELSSEFGVPLVEDAAEALGSKRDSCSAGHWGNCSALSFNGNKIVTTGGGGAVLCHEEAMAAKIRHLSTTAKQPHPWAYVHDEVGYNYRMPNLNASLGLAQLERLPSFLDLKRSLHQKYAEALAGKQGVSFFCGENSEEANHWLNALILEKENVKDRDELLKTLHEHGVLARPVWEPCHRLGMYKNSPSMGLEVTEDLASRIINLPSSPGLAS